MAGSAILPDARAITNQEQRFGIQPIAASHRDIKQPCISRAAKVKRKFAATH